jgi:hypothetical protein
MSTPESSEAEDPVDKKDEHVRNLVTGFRQVATVFSDTGNSINAYTTWLEQEYQKGSLPDAALEMQVELLRSLTSRFQ